MPERTDPLQSGRVLLELALGQEAGLSVAEALWRTLGCQYLVAARLTSRAPMSKGTLLPGEPSEPSFERLETLAGQLSAQPEGGKGTVEKCTAVNLKLLWHDIDKVFRLELERTKGSINRFFEERNPNWNAVGQVCINLAEAPRSAAMPFVLLWTYVSELSESGVPQHRPLRQALTSFGSSAQYMQLLGLLSPIHEVGNRLPWVAASKESGGIFGVEALSATQAYELLKQESLLKSFGISIRTPRTWKGLSPVKPSLTAVIGQNDASFLTAEALLDFNLAVTIGKEKLSEAEVEVLLNGSDEIKFLRGHWVTVDRENIDRIAGQLERMKKIAAGITLPEATRLLAGLEPNEGAERTVWEGVEAGPGLTRLLEDLRHPERIAQLKAPKGLQGKLRSYQKAGVCWLHFMTRIGLGACLADDMGLGKTIQVLTLILALKEESGRAHRPAHLVIAPASVLTNWEKEIEHFAPGLKFRILHSSGAAGFTRSGSATANLRGIDLIVTTYGMLLELESLRKAEWNLVILDEAQAIKNPRTQQARACKALTARARIILTGTPVENHSTDLWSLFDFLNPGLLGSQREFHLFYKDCAARGNLSPLRTLVRPYILRRLKTNPDIGKYLPQKNEKEPIYCQLTASQALLYQRERDALAVELKERAGMKRRGVVLKYITRFRQICNAPEHWQGKKSWETENSGKLMELQKLATQCKKEGRKMLVFTAFAEAVRPLAAHLEKVFGSEGAILDGSIHSTARGPIWMKFQEVPSVRFFVLTIGTGGTGLNLSAASVVLHYDRWWNPAKESQATARAHRFGQKNDVDVYRFISKGTIEERMHDLISSKQALFEELFEVDDPIRITEMSNEEILAFVSLDLNQLAPKVSDPPETDPR